MLTEDLSLFFRTMDFAIAVTYNSTTLVNGLLSKSYVTVNDVENTAPSFTCAASDVPNAKHGDTLVANGINYLVVGVQPDGTGIVTLILEEQ